MIKINISLLVLLLFVCKALFASNDVDDECSELFKSQLKPRECCNYPLRYILPKHQEKCKKSCERLENNSDGCCFLNCNYYNTGVVMDSKVDENALLELYENYLNEKGGGKFDEWLPTVEESIKTCHTLIPKSSKLFTCNIPEYALDLMDCVNHFNFLRCPKFVESRECHELKVFAGKHDKCGKIINGTFIIDYKFFEVTE